MLIILLTRGEARHTVATRRLQPFCPSAKAVSYQVFISKILNYSKKKRVLL